MKQTLFILFFLTSKSAFAQVTFVIDNFSNDYVGKLFIADTTKVFSKGWVAIFDKTSNRQLIKINSDELTFELHKGKVLANIRELPYGEQSQILHEDYNFDGKKDFAIMEGQKSCYHGPSFQIYLATDNGFKQSPEFSRLSQDYCGMFRTDPKTKTIHTMTKSGCCWHQFSEFKVKNNKPYPVKIVEEGLSTSGITWDYKEQNLVNGKMSETTYQKLDLEEGKYDPILSFEIKNKKKMQIFKTGSTLYYVLTDADGKIELLYNGTFKYSGRDNNLSFTNHNTNYVINDDKIIIKTPNNNTYQLQALDNTRAGTLAKVKSLKAENIIP
ncbi:XAC2610-related protein [Chryseobacterium sp. SC28]|uniref:XAC2610-related protein n=1 Tax=Chryseobacterium sp. SC28 TaxID=2268028 RepID=UPI000F65114B|nr:hypothetical protein [Chryseobacterium sp. SC28]RRQ46054.1 hypothetical protein DTW91_07185 [Chryseobacterium sp. SC28]